MKPLALAGPFPGADPRRKGSLVVESNALEMHRTFTGTVGSNPTLPTMGPQNIQRKVP
jgi:hypothetical protein